MIFKFSVFSRKSSFCFLSNPSLTPLRSFAASAMSFGFRFASVSLCVLCGLKGFYQRYQRKSAVKRFGCFSVLLIANFFHACFPLRSFATSALLTIKFVNIWEDLKTDWVCLDCELMPWSAKAQELLRRQYAPTGAAARAALPAAIAALASASQADPEIATLMDQYRERRQAADLYVEAYRRYCWTVRSLTDLKLAPFHLLAGEGAVHSSNNHVWHMETLARICQADPELLLATPYQVIDLTQSADMERGSAWWQDLTSNGGEGMVVKPFDFMANGPKGLVQPAVKVRGREYLRIIYGPEYTLPHNLHRLRRRGLGRKRSLALREFALGLESLERFVHHEPLRRVHECVFGVLALESEPVDPRL